MNKVLESSRTLDKIVSTIGDLPATPVIIATLMDLTSNLNTDIEKIIKVIQADQSLTVKVLKISNSSFYGRAKEVRTLKEAIVILGFMTLHSLIIATSTQNLYQKSTDDEASEKLWEHAFATAIACRLIAQSSRYPYMEEAFVAGLLHDIGKLVLAQKMPPEYHQIIDRVEETQGKFAELEEATLGFNHSQVGSLLLQKWSFPQELIDAVTHHHDPSASDEHHLLLSNIIHLGNFMSKNLNVGFNDYKVDDLSCLPSATSLGFDVDKLDEVQSQLAERFEDEKELFALNS